MKYAAAIGCLFLLWMGCVLSSLAFPVTVWFHPNRKEYARCVDQMNNAAIFMGEGRESVSSHAWRSGIRFVLWITSFIDKDHCKEANRHEQPVIDFINKPGETNGAAL